MASWSASLKIKSIQLGDDPAAVEDFLARMVASESKRMLGNCPSAKYKNVCHATAAGDCAAVADFFRQGVDVNQRYDYGFPIYPMREALCQRHLDVVRLLLQCGADLSLPITDNEMTPAELCKEGGFQRPENVEPILQLLQSPPEPMPMPPSGYPQHVFLTVLLLRGRNLVAADLNGSSDPYCRVKVTNASGAVLWKKSKATPVIKKNLQPVWLAVLDGIAVEVDPTNQSFAVQIDVMDQDLLGKDDRLGNLKITVTPADYPLDQQLSTSRKWLPLADAKHGEIELALGVFTHPPLPPD